MGRGVEKLIVYQRAKEFHSFRASLLRGIMPKVAACGHLERAGESVMLNIAHSNSTWSQAERVTHIGNANGSALECAACLDVWVVKRKVNADAIVFGKQILYEVVCMLHGMKNVADRIQERHASYGTFSGSNQFAHESLGVYRMALSLIGGLTDIGGELICSRDLCDKIDKASTAIPLNIAEGNGRFTAADRSKYLAIAHKSASQTAVLLDIAVATEKGRQAQDSLGKICRMLTALSNSQKS